MAANPALSLAVQVAAAGVPTSGCRPRRNLATKPHKTTIMAAKSNRAVHYEAGIHTTPTSLEWVSTKRDKIIVAAYPSSAQMEGIPLHTMCRLENKSELKLTLETENRWEGSELYLTDRPSTIEKDADVIFTHEASPKESVRGSVGAVVYKFGDQNQYKWILAWSNTKNDYNKVYTQILFEEVANFNKVKESLEISENTSEATYEEYSSNVEIDSTSPSPILKATLKKQQPIPEPVPQPTPQREA